MANLEYVEDHPKHVKMSGEISETCPQKAAAGLSSAAGRDFDKVACAIPSFAAASELVSAPYSCLVMNTHRRHVALPPLYLNKKKTGLQGELQAELLKFSPSLQGVPLAYDNIQIVRCFGDIYDDSGYIHMDIEANFIIFQPKNGQRLLGKVNKLGVSHVGCLVHGCFNASIPKPNLVSVDTWREAGPRIGSELEFEVIALDADTAGVLLIRGRLDRTRIQEMLAFAESVDSGVADDHAEDTAPVAEPTEASIVEDSTKKKKKKKDKIKEVTEEGVTIKEEVIEEEAASPFFQDGCNTTLELNGTERDINGEKKKKKKKKDKIKEVTEEGVTIKEEVIEEEAASPFFQDGCNTTLELNGTERDINGKKKKKKKKKDKIKEVTEAGVKIKEVIEEKAALPFFQGGSNTTLELNGTERDTNGEKKKKKKKKDKIKEVTGEGVKIKEVIEEKAASPFFQDGSNTTLELNGTESDTNSKKKKKKKEKRIKEEEQVQLSPMEIHTSDSSGYHTDKPNKKRKHEKESEITASFSQDAEAPKSKKKKRKSDV
ncbi:DNA-directed RNA polymerase I subunit RPA43 [Phyllopteryx taeniolatus]|uniref:DNA-directed RNA polymerase I subunit RPA43 n=1 Tax=Phyllopteryx taeniolatus TaxID=161469 RepID=UPI002AD5AEEB|nr:DNA-directed RNA polymerase I subunit RPA43 [Phyllopteryx taeniolatus]